MKLAGMFGSKKEKETLPGIDRVTGEGIVPFYNFFKKDLFSVFSSREDRKELVKLVKLELKDRTNSNLFAERKWYLTESLDEDILKNDRSFLSAYTNLHTIHRARFWLHNNGKSEKFDSMQSVIVIKFLLQNTGYGWENEHQDKWFVDIKRLLVIEEIRMVVEMADAWFGENKMLDEVRAFFSEYSTSAALTATLFSSEIKQMYKHLYSLNSIVFNLYMEDKVREEGK